ncbi:DUF1549 and DUF1553 domain-containing protein [Fimbriiglobus ruber]|uniref:DUF1549 domain-containing protein n=1 Tax=Fimbriiglobus ruber TaxID=1908690 RepID=A0A225D5T0_9BACT|nr:DUF1549 and DUF1553 domain-containing protein [Fimbriiglobus ruber]OWK34994.1 hypothetical protein FRUB_09836 [Fimbriiglobus ruber]
MNRFPILFAVMTVVAFPAAAAERDPAALARRIDQHLEARWKQENVAPAARADDAEFLRRVHLDLIGRIPTVTEVRTFLADRAPDKREKLIDRLIAQPGSAAHFAKVWCQHWLPQSATQFEELKPEFEDWLQSQLRANVPYDRMVRSLLAAPGGPVAGRSAQVFLQANEYKPANLAGSTARTFLGLNIDCAQCHDHPFARWTKDQFWEFAAFFADPTAQGRRVLKLTPPNSKTEVTAKFVDGSEPKWAGEPTAAAGRLALTDWLVSSKNPYFAKNAVNRAWADFFGTGLVEPLDDLSGAMKPSHPELLDDLAEAFAESGFDLQFLIRALTRTRAYQLASAGPSANPPHLFSRFALRSMSGDQLFDSVILAAGLDPREADRASFLARFGRPERPTEAGRTILQSLTLMNSKTLTDATSPAGGGTLTAVADAPFLDTAGRVDALYLAAYSRLPRPEERDRLIALVDKGGAARDPRRALASVFWVLLNSHEFAVIH